MPGGSIIRNSKMGYPTLEHGCVRISATDLRRERRGAMGP